jgi:hypothetical protein
MGVSSNGLLINQRNVKAMGRQLEEGNSYSSDKSKKVAGARTITVTVTVRWLDTALGTSLWW